MEDAFRQPSERNRIALVLDAESAHRQVIDLLDTLRQLVLPRHVVDGARREHLDVGVPGEPLGDIPRVQFGAAVDGVAVPLNDDRRASLFVVAAVGVARVRFVDRFGLDVGRFVVSGFLDRTVRGVRDDRFLSVLSRIGYGLAWRGPAWRGSHDRGGRSASPSSAAAPPAPASLSGLLVAAVADQPGAAGRGTSAIDREPVPRAALSRQEVASTRTSGAGL